jgi:membrane-bound lytic murein transglycosylase A
VDPEVVPLGAPVWIEAGGFRRLFVAQDRGGAIRGAQRADVVFGTGAEAGRRAGEFLHPGRMVVLWPREVA